MSQLGKLLNTRSFVSCAGCFLASTALLSMPLFADGTCSLTVHVHGPDSLPINQLWAELIDANGITEIRKEVSGRTIYICDFGFGPHTLRVLTNGILPVSISNIQLIIDSPLTLHVYLNGYGYPHVMRTACLLYVRVLDETGAGVAGADISYALPIWKLGSTDSYGRFQGLFSGSREVLVTKEGYAPHKVAIQCRATEQIDLSVPLKRLVVR